MRKRYVWNPATCNCEIGKYLASNMDDLLLWIKTTCITQNINILLVFLSI